MQVIITISDKDYEDIMWDAKFHPRNLDFFERRVAEGTPLPKEHGRLIDANEIEYTHEIARLSDDGHMWTELCATKDEIDDVPTIIEAERSKDADSD